VIIGVLSKGTRCLMCGKIERSVHL